MLDRIDDVVYNPIEEANEDERQERIAQLRNKLKRETKNNENSTKEDK